jgi:hypothetical protein
VRITYTYIYTYVARERKFNASHIIKLEKIQYSLLTPHCHEAETMVSREERNL